MCIYIPRGALAAPRYRSTGWMNPSPQGKRNKKLGNPEHDKTEFFVRTNTAGCFRVVRSPAEFVPPKPSTVRNIHFLFAREVNPLAYGGL